MNTLQRRIPRELITLIQNSLALPKALRHSRNMAVVTLR